MFDAANRLMQDVRRKLDAAWYSSVVTTKARQLAKKRRYVTPDLYDWADRVDSLFARHPDMLSNSAVWTPGQALERLGWIAILLDEYTKAMGTHVVSTSV